MIKAVAIDVDDTLVLTEAACFEMENEVVESMGLPRFSRDIHLQTWGKPLFEIITTRAPGIDAAEFKRRLLPVMRQKLADGTLDQIPPENFAALDVLMAQGKKLFVLTSRTEAELEHMLEPDHELAKRVEAVYHRDNNMHHKPNPLAFQMLLEEHELKPEECVYVGDSLGDAESSTGAGLHFIASLEGGLKTEADFKDYKVDAYIYKFPEIVGAIAKLDRSVTS